ncbi:MAG: hypothetical protein GY797_10260 [Deltaproteobacteria bacterium]|nr:hypothetical protein [Deltaproteobacteria bacterium]
MRIFENKSKTMEGLKPPEPAPTVSYNIQELRRMDIASLLRLLHRPEMNLAGNASIQREILSILRERKGPAFVQSTIHELPANAAFLKENLGEDQDTTLPSEERTENDESIRNED